jgi:hypothetical protein
MCRCRQVLNGSKQWLPGVQERQGIGAQRAMNTRDLLYMPRMGDFGS